LYTAPRQAIRLPVRREQLPARIEMRLCLPSNLTVSRFRYEVIVDPPV